MDSLSLKWRTRERSLNLRSGLIWTGPLSFLSWPTKDSLPPLYPYIPDFSLSEMENEREKFKCKERIYLDGALSFFSDWPTRDLYTFPTPYYASEKNRRAKTAMVKEWTEKGEKLEKNPITTKTIKNCWKLLLNINFTQVLKIILYLNKFFARCHNFRFLI